MTGLPDQAVKSPDQPWLFDLCVKENNPVAGFLRYALLLTACLFTSPVCADMFFGAKAGLMMVDVSTDKNPLNLALNLGYQLDTRVAELSLAGEVNRTISEGRTRSGEELEFESEAIYLVYRTPRSLFVSLRGGIAWDKVVIDGDSSRGDGLLLGAGFGIVAGKTLIQIEYTSIAGDANFLSVSLEF